MLRETNDGVIGILRHAAANLRRIESLVNVDFPRSIFKSVDPAFALVATPEAISIVDLATIRYANTTTG